MSSYPQGSRLSQAPVAYEVENFYPQEFELPMEEFDDGRLSHYALTQQAMAKRRINNAKKELKKELLVGKKLNNATDSMTKRIEEDSMSKMMSFGKSINLGDKRSLIGTRMHNVKGEAKSELDFVKSIVERDRGKLQEVANKTVKDFEDESTIEFPKLHTVEEKIEDLRQEGYETWWRRRGREIAARFSNKDKRMLRKWFQELDYDHSGEVSVVELQDPMLSAGIFKTREQIFRVMLNADKNDTMGLDFEEFLNALYNSRNKLIDTNKLKKLQAMGSDPNGIQMDTLITAERRRKITNSILNQMEKREKEFQSAHDKYIRSSRKYEKEKKRQKEEEAREQLLRQQQSQYKGTSSRTTQRFTTAADGTKIMSAAQRKAANRNNPVFKEHMKNTENLKLVELGQERDKKLHDRYLMSLDVVLKQKRAQADRFMDMKMAAVRGVIDSGLSVSGDDLDDANALASASFGSTREGLANNAKESDPLLQRSGSNRWHAYKRRPSNPSMFGKNHRRAYQLSVEQPGGKTHLDVLD